MTHERFLVTGGAGFIVSAFVRRAVRDRHRVLNLEKLTYAGRLSSVAEVSARPIYEHVHRQPGATYAVGGNAECSSLERTVRWYLSNRTWCNTVQGAVGSDGDRLGRGVSGTAA